MKSKLGMAVLAAVFAVATLMPQANTYANESDGVRQGELALMLVNVLGLYRFLPAAPTEQEAVAVLITNSIEPAGGWDLSKPVVLADLAQLIVMSIDRAHEVENPDNPQSWIDYLVSIDVPIDTIGLALTNVEPLPEPIAGNVFVAAVTTDPLKKREITGQPDESESGTDVSITPTERLVTLPMIQEVVAVIPDVPRRPGPVTPD